MLQISMIEALSSPRALLCRGSFTQGSRSLRLLTQVGKFKHHEKGIRNRSYSKCRLIMMPEGPEVRTVVDQLQQGVGMRYEGINFLSGRYVRHGPPSGYEDFCKTLTTDVEKGVDLIQEWRAKGKFIYITLDDGDKKPPPGDDDDFQRSIWITLGMSGRFISEALNDQQRTTPRWSIQLRNDKDSSKKMTQIFYHDPRNFGTLKFCLSAKALQEKVNSLGPDILDPNTTADVFIDIVAKQKPEMNVCKFLMNQKKLCGVGNYILAEGLYRSLVDPFCSLKEIEEEQLRSLFYHIKETATQSYQAQGLTRDGGAYRDVEGNEGKFRFQLQCYGRETCARGNPVIKEMDGPHKRTIWYTESQLFMPRILRFGKIEETDEGEDNEDGETEEAAASNQRTISNSKIISSHSSKLVSQLTSSLKDEGWKEALSDTINSEKFHELALFLDEERIRGEVIYPPEKDIFAALNLCPLDKVKVVIVGQDPYHGPGQGHGLSFSVRPGINPPPSLKNIFREIKADVGITAPNNNNSGDLSHWARQGVLLLNSVLTVQKGRANSHAKKGWEEFTGSIIDIVNNQKNDVVFLLWGNPAHRKASNVDEHRHTIIRTSHPSPLGATKTKNPFLGSRCFSRTNEALSSAGKETIEWKI